VTLSDFHSPFEQRNGNYVQLVNLTPPAVPTHAAPHTSPPSSACSPPHEQHQLAIFNTSHSVLSGFSPKYHSNLPHYHEPVLSADLLHGDRAAGSGSQGSVASRGTQSCLTTQVRQVTPMLGNHSCLMMRTGTLTS
jgi:hypothetical protein